MANKRKKRKQITPGNQDKDISKIKALVTEIVETVKLMAQDSKNLVWEHWLKATEALKDIINLPFVDEGGLNKSATCLSENLSEPQESQEKPNYTLTVINDGDSEQNVPFNNSSQANIEELLEELNTKVAVNDNHINEGYNDEQKQTSCSQRAESNTRLSAFVTGEDPSEITVDPISNRRSTRKRQITAKAQELQDKRKIKLKKPINDEITSKRKDPNATGALNQVTTSSLNSKKINKQVICEIIRFCDGLEARKNENPVLAHAVVSKTNPEMTNNEKQPVPAESDQRVTQELPRPGDFDKTGGPIPTSTTLGDMNYANGNTVFLNMENEGHSHIITLGIQDGSVHVDPMGAQVQQGTQHEVVCADCGQAFLEEKALKVHIRTMHPVEKDTSKSTTCGECGKTFCNRSNLKSHINLCHKGRRDFICDTCGKEFHTKSNLQRHIRSHTGEKPWKCFKCDATFTEKKSMERHTLIHTGLKLYKCDVCGRCLATAWSLKQHQAQHDERALGSYLCDTCGKTFSLKNNLQSHKKVHLSTRPHPCSLCKRSFYGKGDLDRHMRSHTGEKPYDCKVCNKRFSRLEYLREHLNAHAGIMPYSCPTCGKGFTDRSGYHKHSKRCAIRKPTIQVGGDQDEEQEETVDVGVELEGEGHTEQMEEEPIDVTSQVTNIHLDPPTLEVPSDQVGFIDLDPQTNELQVHQIFCTSEETPGAVTEAEQVIDLASSASTYTVLSDDHVVSASTMADFVCHQPTSLSVDDNTVETIQHEAHLQWYVQDVVNGEPWQGIG